MASAGISTEQKALMRAMKRERKHVDAAHRQDARDSLQAAKEESYDEGDIAHWKDFSPKGSSPKNNDGELVLPAVHRLLRELEIILELGKGRESTTAELVEEVRANVFDYPLRSSQAYHPPLATTGRLVGHPHT
jgi:hypothetical protein